MCVSGSPRTGRNVLLLLIMSPSSLCVSQHVAVWSELVSRCEAILIVDKLGRCESNDLSRSLDCPHLIWAWMTWILLFYNLTIQPCRRSGQACFDWFLNVFLKYEDINYLSPPEMAGIITGWNYRVDSFKIWTNCKNWKIKIYVSISRLSLVSVLKQKSMNCMRNR